MTQFPFQFLDLNVSPAVMVKQILKGPVPSMKYLKKHKKHFKLIENHIFQHIFPLTFSFKFLSKQKLCGACDHRTLLLFYKNILNGNTAAKRKLF